MTTEERLRMKLENANDWVQTARQAKDWTTYGEAVAEYNRILALIEEERT